MILNRKCFLIQRFVLLSESPQLKEIDVFISERAVSHRRLVISEHPCKHIASQYSCGGVRMSPTAEEIFKQHVGDNWFQRVLHDQPR